MFSWAPDSPSFQRGIASVWWWRKFGFNFHSETHGYYSLKKYWHSEDVQALLLQQLPIAPTACEALVALRAVKAEMLETSCLLHSSFEISKGGGGLSCHQILRAATCTQNLLLQKNDSNNMSKITAVIRKITCPAVYWALSRYPGLFQSHLIYYFISSLEHKQADSCGLSPEEWLQVELWRTP